LLFVRTQCGRYYVEEGIYHPLGSTKQERSTFRLIAATNLQLSELQRRLDPDFLDRISALQLRVPALKELPEDLGWLWNSTFEMATRRCGLPGNLLSLKQQDHQRIVERLKSFPLDGNLRDLFRVSNRLIASLHDQVNPLSILDAIEYAVNGLQSSTGKLVSLEKSPTLSLLGNPWMVCSQLKVGSILRRLSSPCDALSRPSYVGLRD
jgi:transcriptional regulator with AAA-type ATPase domain